MGAMPPPSPFCLPWPNRAPRLAWRIAGARRGLFAVGQELVPYRLLGH
jgi:hypothetical protein